MVNGQHQRDGRAGANPVAGSGAGFGAPGSCAVRGEGGNAFRDRWAGERCYIVASGPSAKDQDLSKIEGHGRVIAVNNSFELVPFADALYAADWDWWQRKNPAFNGERWTCSAELKETHRYVPYQKGCGIGDGFVYTGHGNSGFQALNLALQWGCREIYLIGFDMKYRGGQKHWHPDHQGNNPSEHQLKQWAQGYGELSGLVERGRVKVVGDSALECFERVSFEDSIPTCEGVVGVLRSGGWCTPEHAKRLSDSVTSRHKYVLLTDMEVPGVECRPLRYGWPGWWSKMELFALEGDWLYMDMDTMVYGDVSPYMVRRPALLGDFYHRYQETGLMYLTERMKRVVWDRWIADPDRWMREYRGDGAFIRDTLGSCFDLREVGGIHSYKVHGKQPDTALLVFHGQPRPHETVHWHES